MWIRFVFVGSCPDVNPQIKREATDGELLEKPKRKRGRPKKKRDSDDQGPSCSSGSNVPVSGGCSGSAPMNGMMRQTSLPPSGQWNNYPPSSQQASTSSTATSQSSYFMPQDQYYNQGNQGSQNQYYMYNNPAASSASTSSENGQYYMNDMYQSMPNSSSYYGEHSQNQMNASADCRMNYMNNPSCAESSPSASQPFVRIKTEKYDPDESNSIAQNFGHYNPNLAKPRAENFNSGQPSNYGSATDQASPGTYGAAPLPENFMPANSEAYSKHRDAANLESYGGVDANDTFGQKPPVSGSENFSTQEQPKAYTPEAYGEAESGKPLCLQTLTKPFNQCQDRGSGFNPGQAESRVYNRQESPMEATYQNTQKKFGVPHGYQASSDYQCFGPPDDYDAGNSQTMPLNFRMNQKPAENTLTPLDRQSFPESVAPKAPCDDLAANNFSSTVDDAPSCLGGKENEVLRPPSNQLAMSAASPASRSPMRPPSNSPFSVNSPAVKPQKTLPEGDAAPGLDSSLTEDEVAEDKSPKECDNGRSTAEGSIAEPPEVSAPEPERGDSSENEAAPSKEGKSPPHELAESPINSVLSVGNSSNASSCVQPPQESASSPTSQQSVGTNPGSMYSESSPMPQNAIPSYKNSQSPKVDHQPTVRTGSSDGSIEPAYQNGQLVPLNEFSNSPVSSSTSSYSPYNLPHAATSRFSAFSPSSSLSSTSLSALSSYVSAWSSNSGISASQPAPPRAFAATSMSTNLGPSLHAAAAHSEMSLQAMNASLSSQSSVQSLAAASSSMHALGASMSTNASVQGLGGAGRGFQSLHATAALATNLGMSASAAASMQTFGMMSGQQGFSTSMSAARSWSAPSTFGSSLQRAQGHMAAAAASHMMSPWSVYNSYSHGYNQNYHSGYGMPEQGDVTYSQHFHMKQEPRGYYGDGEY